MIALDFETTGLNMHEPDSAVKSMALSWYAGGQIVSRFVTKPEDILRDLMALSASQAPVCVYNVGFEGLVLLSKFPQIKLNIVADVMRLVQVYANDDSVMSFGLKASAPRILGLDFGNWESEIKTWLKENGHGPADLHLAPRDILRRYNIGDTEATLRLYTEITNQFEIVKYNWKFDHALYLATAYDVVKAKFRGVGVNREGLASYIEALHQALKDNELDFISKLPAEIAATETLLTQKEQAKFKKKIVSRVTFNIESNTHREVLFCKVMKIEPKYLTPGGSPSFKSEHVSSYGEFGKLLSDRKSQQIILTQAENLYKLSAKSGRWHLDLKLSGTSTGRLSGGSQ